MTAPLVSASDRPFQLLPPLTVEQRDLLRQSIRENGVLEPVVFDEDGEILDGHHRVEIAEELGIEYPRRVIDDLDEPGKHMYALTVNVARRQLDSAARGGLVAQMRIRGMSIRQIAKAVGIDPKTVRNDLAQVGNQSPPDRVTGSDGKSYASSRPTPKPIETPGPVETPSTASTGPGPSPAPAAAAPSSSQEPAVEPETCLGADMDCGRPLPCPDHPRTPEERIAAVAEVAPEFVKPVEAQPKPSLRLVPTVDEKTAAERRDARAMLSRGVDLLAPARWTEDHVQAWIEHMGPDDDELAALKLRAVAAIAVLTRVIEEAGR